MRDCFCVQCTYPKEMHQKLCFTHAKHGSRLSVLSGFLYGGCRIQTGSLCAQLPYCVF